MSEIEESSSAIEETKSDLTFAWALIGAIAVAAIVVLGFYYNYFFIELNYENSSDPSDWGALGDYFGGILNPIVGMATLVFVGLTLSLTQKALGQNAKALLQSEKALLQSEKALEQARQMIEQGQVVIEQNATELRESRKVQEEARDAQFELAKIETQNLEDRKKLDEYNILKIIHDSSFESYLKFIKTREVSWVSKGISKSKKSSLAEVIKGCANSLSAAHLDLGDSVENKIKGAAESALELVKSINSLSIPLCSLSEEISMESFLTSSMQDLIDLYHFLQVLKIKQGNNTILEARNIPSVAAFIETFEGDFYDLRTVGMVEYEDYEEMSTFGRFEKN